MQPVRTTLSPPPAVLLPPEAGQLAALPSRGEAVWAVEQAGRAPSVHNTQPWRFSYAAGVFELWADRSRTLRAADPDGRELVLSCGAALCALRLALRALGFTTTLRTLPDPNLPDLLATVGCVRSGPPGAEQRRLLTALGRRHTHRGEFDGRPVSPALALYLQHAAHLAGAQLIYPQAGAQRRAVLALAREAENVLHGDARVRRELARWAPATAAGRPDGVPAEAYPATASLSAQGLAPRDFDRGRGLGRVPRATSGDGLVAVLATEHDRPGDWLAGGQALQSVLVTAAREWVFAALHSQVVEVPALRRRLRSALGGGAHPQLLLRLGHALETTRTPRRPPEDVLAGSGTTAAP